MNCVKGEIHNVLSMMRVNARWASADRFKQEIPASTQSPMMRAFKQLHYELQWVTDLSDVDTVTYLLPFLMVIESDRTSGFITGAAISSLNKFLLYGLITSESLRADVAINRIAVCVSRCRFEETHRADDEAVLMKLLELVEYCLRCDAGHLITGDNVWKMIQLCYSISNQPRSSLHLCRAAENTLAHLILTVFDRIDHLEPRKQETTETAADKQPIMAPHTPMDGNDHGSETTATTTAVPPPPNSGSRIRSSGYGIPLLEKILQFLSGLISPSAKDDMTCILGLRLINIVLETAGTGLSNHMSLVSVLQGDLSKYLLQNSETEDLAILSLILRVVFNLFNSIKDHLKVQLEVFFTSVHMRIIDSPSCSDEQKELALESLLEFCREPAMMLDLYINYDCDVHCTNLFEVLCKSLARNCQARESANGSLNALTRLCLEGLLAVIESIARRCPLGANGPYGDNNSGSMASISGLHGADLARFTSSSTDMAGDRTLRRTASSDVAMEDVSPLSSVRDLMQLVMSGSDSESDYDPSEEVGGGSSPSTPSSSSTATTTAMDQLAWLHAARERTAEVLQQRKRTKKRYALAAEKFNTDQKKWIAYAQEMELLPETITPESVASFLLHTPGLNKTLIGDFLGDGPPEQKPFNTAVRDAYLAMLDFRDAKSLDEALRMFLSRFRLPGEAQKIDRMMEAFANQFYTQCGASGPLAKSDAAFILSFSIIMLNTDLHSDNIAKKMTLEEFVRNNRGINDGKDLPAAYLTTLYNNIKNKEIQMQHDVSDFNEQFTVDRYSTQWEGVLKRSENVVGASFTSNSSILKLRAGLYEKDMYTLICDATIKCISLAYEKTCDATNMERALDGLSNCAKIALYYDMSELFNKIMASLSTYFLAFAHGILNGEKIFMPPAASGAHHQVHGGAGGHSNKLSSTASAVAALGSSTRRHPSSSADDDDNDDDQDDETMGTTGSSAAATRALSPRAGLDVSNGNGNMNVNGLLSSMGEDGISRGAKMRRALLSLKLLFQFVQQRHESFRKAWASVIECVLMFNELDVVPTSLVEMDDFVDARGVPLPPIQGNGSASSPYTQQPPSPLAPSSSSPGGVAGKTRERSRRVAERQAAIRSRMKSMQAASSGSGSGYHTSYGSSGTSSNHHPPTSGGSLWGSLSSYLWAEEEKVDESFSMVSKILREAVAKLGAGVLEKENWLRLERKLGEPSLTSLLETLLTCRDPFKGMLLQAPPGDATPGGLAGTTAATTTTAMDPMMQENAILVLELSVDLMLVNAHRIVPLNLWSRFHKYAEKILQTPFSELHDQLHGLAERVVVHILRVSIRLFHDEKIRPQLMKTLTLLLEMDDDMYKALSDRVAIGINMLLKANLVYMHDFHEWQVLMGILENVVQYKNGRASCWESVKLLAEGGHLNDENVTLWIATCLRFVSHRTPYSVDALRLLQGLAASDSAYKMDGRVWLEVMRVMLSYLNDDRAPIAKTAWECLYNSLLLPGVPVAKETWKHCFDDVIFTFDDQVNEGVWRHSKEAALYSVTLLAKTFLHNLRVLVELADFNELWLNVLRRLAHKLHTAGQQAAASAHAATVFETTLQSLYNLLLILQAEEVLDRECLVASASSPAVAGENATSLRQGTLFEATYAVVDQVIPHMKEQLGLMPPPPPAPAPAATPETTPVSEAVVPEVASEAATQPLGVENETGMALDDDDDEHKQAEAVLAAHFQQASSTLPPTSDREQVASGSSTSRTGSGRVMEKIVVADGTIAVKVDEILIDEITEAV